jgi:hypothetical protein
MDSSASKPGAESGSVGTEMRKRAPAPKRQKETDPPLAQRPLVVRSDKEWETLRLVSRDINRLASAGFYSFVAHKENTTQAKLAWVG